MMRVDATLYVALWRSWLLRQFGLMWIST